MRVLKCKMCGGNLEILQDSKIFTCEFCETTQTLPALDSEKKVNLFNRANLLRSRCEFDKAESIYMQIIEEEKEEAEAYWGICLCRYGIEYIDDPLTAKKMPTCHRTSFNSILDDEDFMNVMKYSSNEAKEIYKLEAKEIDRIQKDILEIVRLEKPYDVFICYKETDINGDRTEDSVIAQDIYESLTERGFKVFFARITLEDKLGSKYEPYIFAALNSAKVMLVIGTKEEHFNAVWVKNEWSRFIFLARKNKEKVLIPCYKYIDAYEMPSEFSNLQGIDMSKIGFKQDLLRGIEKVIGSKNINQDIPNQSVLSSSNVSKLLKRAMMFMEDENWEKGREYCERVLDEDPENSQAYFYILLCSYKAKDENDLLQNTMVDIKSYDFIKAYKYCGEYERQVLDKIKSKDLDRSIEEEYNHLLEEKNLVLKKGKIIQFIEKIKTDENYKNYSKYREKLEQQLNELNNKIKKFEVDKQKFKEKYSKESMLNDPDYVEYRKIMDEIRGRITGGINSNTNRDSDDLIYVLLKRIIEIVIIVMGVGLFGPFGVIFSLWYLFYKVSHRLINKYKSTRNSEQNFLAKVLQLITNARMHTDRISNRLMIGLNDVKSTYGEGFDYSFMQNCIYDIVPISVFIFPTQLGYNVGEDASVYLRSIGGVGQYKTELFYKDSGTTEWKKTGLDTNSNGEIDFNFTLKHRGEYKLYVVVTDSNGVSGESNKVTIISN